MNVAIATPCYGGMIHARTAGAIAYSIAMLARSGKPTWLTIEGESLVPRARNVLVRQFLASNAERLVFIDADIEFRPPDLLRLLAKQEAVVGVAYPKKKPGTELVYTPLIDGGKERGALEEVARIGTGFLSISRKTIERLVAAHPETAYYADDGHKVHALFDTAVRDGQYLSEDWLFCDRWRGIGGQVWRHTGITLGHIGSITYGSP